MTNFKHNKNLGQHFLVDMEVINLILLSAGDLSNKTVIEIGVGDFALTKYLIKKAKKVVAIEIDKRIEKGLADLKNKHDNFDYIIGDALQINPLDIKEDNKVLISNLPYNVGTQIYLNYLHLQDNFEYLLLMFQLEVAKRITAKVGDNNYGRLSIVSDLLSKREFLFEVDQKSFSPPPKVKSAVIKIHPFDKPRIDVDLKKLERVTNLAFQGKRKTIRNSLSQLELNFDELNINSQKRAEELSTEEFCKIANKL